MNDDSMYLLSSVLASTVTYLTLDWQSSPESARRLDLSNSTVNRCEVFGSGWRYGTPLPVLVTVSDEVRVALLYFRSKD